jgi:hypothetical protein
MSCWRRSDHLDASLASLSAIRASNEADALPATALAFSFWARERESAQHNARLHALLEQQRALEVALSTAREGAQAEASQLVAEASLQASAIESR